MSSRYFVVTDVPDLRIAAGNCPSFVDFVAGHRRAHQLLPSTLEEDATMPCTMKVVEIGSGIEHELPGDAVTRDAPTLARPPSPSGPVVPLAFRPADVAFYVSGNRWPELAGKLVRRSV